jgi:hypothetical protein
MSVALQRLLLLLSPEQGQLKNNSSWATGAIAPQLQTCWLLLLQGVCIKMLHDDVHATGDIVLA